jgi:hypothetical protein
MANYLEQIIEFRKQNAIAKYGDEARQMLLSAQKYLIDNPKKDKVTLAMPNHSYEFWVALCTINEMEGGFYLKHALFMRKAKISIICLDSCDNF